MSKKCFFTVPYHGGEIAKFSSLKDALLFAQAVSASKETVEVRNPAGIVGEYQDGRPTFRYIQQHKDFFDRF